MSHLSSRDQSSNAVTSVRITRAIRWGGETVNPGKVIEIPFSDARRLIGEGAAEPVNPDRFGRPVPSSEMS